MAEENLLDRISINPNVCFGKPVIRGTRIWVSLLLDFLADGMTEDELLERYPQMTRDDIRAALRFGAMLSRFDTIEVPVGSTD